MPRLRLRLWILLVLVAVAALGLGGYGWWHGRHERLRMAAWHEWRAGNLVELMEFLLAADDLTDELQRLGREADAVELPRDEVARVCASLGRPVPAGLDRPLAARQEEIRTQVELWKTWRAPFAIACQNAQRWHAERAKRLRRQQFFLAAHEHDIDLRQYEAMQQLAGQFGEPYTAGINAARHRRKDAESTLRKQLEPLRAASRERSTDARMLQMDLIKIYVLLDTMSRQQDLFLGVHSELQSALTSAPPDYQSPSPPAAAPSPPAPLQQASTRP